MSYSQSMFKIFVFGVLVAGSAPSFACGERLVGLRDRLESAREKLVDSLTSSFEPSRVLAQLELADYWEDRLGEGLDEGQRIELNAYLTTLELAPVARPRPRFLSGSKADRETDDFYQGPY